MNTTMQLITKVNFTYVFIIYEIFFTEPIYRMYRGNPVLLTMKQRQRFLNEGGPSVSLNGSRVDY